jgi:hypothetical protein
MSGALRILSETRIDVDDAGRRMGPEGRPVHYTSVYRAMRLGRLAPDGERVRLEHLRCGGRLMTSVEAVERYLARLNGIELDAAEENPARRTKRREAVLRAVDKELDAIGI